MLRSVLIPHAAELLGVSRRTVYYRIRAGTLKTVRTLGGSQRVLMESIEAALRAERRRRKRHGAQSTARRSGVRWSVNRVLRTGEGVVLAIR
jgi:excisionase family DNA binding protein